MPTLAISDKAQITPEHAKTFARLTFDHGDGYVPSLLVGNSQGTVESYVLRWVLPDREDDARFMVADPEDGNTSKTWLQYLKDFIDRRGADGASFTVVDQTTGSNLDVVLVSYSLPLQGAGKKAFTAELRVKQWRDAA